mgnify:CR=1 FL=1
MARLLNILLLFIVIGLSAWIVSLQAQVRELTQKVGVPTATDAGVQFTSESVVSKSVSHVAEPVLKSAIDSAEASSQVASDVGRAVTWRVEWQLGEIEKQLALDDTQRAALREQLQSDFTDQQSAAKGEPDGYDENAAILAVVGEDRAQEYRQAVVRARTAREEKELESELFTLSRKLGLSLAQEEQLNGALIAVNQATQPIREQIAIRMRAAMRSHSGASSDNESLQARYDEITALNEQLDSARVEALKAQMQGKLTDQQMNALMGE